MRQWSIQIGRLSGLLLLALVSACSVKPPTSDEMKYLNHYQRTTAYDGVMFTAKESADAELNDRQESFLIRLKVFAGKLGIPVIEPDQKTDNTAEINIAMETEFLVAQLLENSLPVQSLQVPTADPEPEEFIFNELLLLWHPQNILQDERKPVPGYVLQPTSYQVLQGEIFEGLQPLFETV